ncbi:hypothetical protein MED121_21460 [Marinomonas sp. MED121]|uniref:GGDEF domain-containing protein n=1 Tax=Marinomonas sp. MED121 TaxID=314277 RepID=UPI0000690865|nr:GGDEF domain-containing protein [Marinomonas sp. MED121]EAQ64561.1 hypothetical protein MED121_21460 [Marinomonas sp. MED121]
MPSPQVNLYLEQLNRLLNFQGISWWLIDVQNEPDYFYCNQTMTQAFSLDASLEKHSVSHTCPIAGDFLKNVELKSDKQAKLICTEYRKLLSQDIDEYNNQFPYYNQEHKKNYHYKSRARVLACDYDGCVSLIFGVIEDISEWEAQRLKIEQQKRKFKKLSEKDPVTNLYNRRYFMTVFKQGFYQAQRDQKSIAILMLDTDNFKRFNDYYGHLKGNDCLKLIAKSIASVFNRKTDIVARFGGDEFIICVTGVKADMLEKMAFKLREKIFSEKALQPDEPSLPRISLSIGAYIGVPQACETQAEAYIKYADDNLYKAKHQGKNRIEISQGKILSLFDKMTK